jgi:hypothetical protein
MNLFLATAASTILVDTAVIAIFYRLLLVSSCRINVVGHDAPPKSLISGFQKLPTHDDAACYTGSNLFRRRRLLRITPNASCYTSSIILEALAF